MNVQNCKCMVKDARENFALQFKKEMGEGRAELISSITDVLIWTWGQTASILQVSYRENYWQWENQQYVMIISGTQIINWAIMYFDNYLLAVIGLIVSLHIEPTNF